MRSSTVARLSKAMSLFCAAALCCGLIPIAAHAAQPSLSLIPEGEQGAALVGSGAEGGGAEALSHCAADAAPSVDGGSAAIPSEDADDTARDADAAEAPKIVNEELPLDTVIAQAESTKSFFLAQTLESTRTVPMVSAKLPIDSGTDGKDAESGEGAEGTEPVEGVSAGSTVVGAFEQDGMTFAIETDGGSVALMAVDYAKLPRECVSKQVVVIPDAVSPDGIDSYSVARIGSGAFSSLKKESADPAFAGCEALFSDEELLAEAGMDPSEVEGFLSDESDASATQNDQGAIAPSDAQAGADVREDGSDPSAEEGVSAGSDGAEKVRTIVSVEGDVATLDDGSTYEFGNPLAGCTGILALSIPSSVSSIEDDAFSGSDTLQYLVVSDDNRAYASFDGALYSADMSELLSVPEGRKGAVRIASSAADVDSEMLSHCPSVSAVVDEGSAAYILVDEHSGSKGANEILFEAYANNGDRYAGCHEAESIDSGWSSGQPDAVLSDAASSYAASSVFELTTQKPASYYLINYNSSGVVTGSWDIGMPFRDTNISYFKVHGDYLEVRYLDGHWIDIHPRALGGYTHRGYFHRDNWSQQFADGSVVQMSENRWIVHLYTTDSYTVSFANVNAATSSPSSFKYTVESSDKTLSAASRVGYTFAGWNVTGASGSGITGNGTTNVTVKKGTYGNLTATAKWTPNTYAVSFDANGGSGGQTDGVTATYDAAMPAISAAAPTREGYRFGGWYDTTGSSAGTQYYTADGTSARAWNKAADTTLYARWIADISWVNEGKNGTSDKAKFPDSVFNVSGDDLACSVVAPDPGSRKGYDFAGWAVYEADGTTLRDDNGGSFYQVGSTIPVKGRSSIQARWEVTKGTSKPSAGIHAVGEDETAHMWTFASIWPANDAMNRRVYPTNGVSANLSQSGPVVMLDGTDQSGSLPDPSKALWSDRSHSQAMAILETSGGTLGSDSKRYVIVTLNPDPVTGSNQLTYDGRVYSYGLYGWAGSSLDNNVVWRTVSYSDTMMIGSEPFAVLYPGPGKLLRFWQYGGEEAEVATPDDAGEVFVGWFDEEQASTDPYAEGSYFCGGIGDALGEASANVPELERSKNLYAHYMPDGHDVVFDANGGAHPEGTGVEVPVIWVKHGSALPENLKTGETPNASDDPYRKPYDHVSQSYEEAANASPKKLSDVVATSRRGYRFDGYWTTKSAESGVEVIDGRTVEAKQYYGSGMEPKGEWTENDLATTTLYAHWTPRTYKMSFDLSFDDGSASWKDGEAPAEDAYDAIVYDTPVTFPKAPVRAGWIFTGWVPVEADAAKDLYAAEETVDPGNFASEQDAITSFEAHWVKNLEVSVPLGSKDVGLSVSADLVEGTEFDVVKGASEIANLSDGELKVVSVREDASDADALSTRKANALEAFGGASSDPSKVEAVSFVLRPTTDGASPDASKEEARFPLFGSHAFETDSWRIPASSGATDPSTLRILYDLAFDYSKIAITDLELNLEAKPISSLVFTVELVDPTEPSYSASA